MSIFLIHAVTRVETPSVTEMTSSSPQSLTSAMSASLSLGMSRNHARNPTSLAYISLPSDDPAPHALTHRTPNEAGDAEGDYAGALKTKRGRKSNTHAIMMMTVPPKAYVQANPLGVLIKEAPFLRPTRHEAFPNPCAADKTPARLGAHTQQRRRSAYSSRYQTAPLLLIARSPPSTGTPAVSNSRNSVARSMSSSTSYTSSVSVSL